VIREQTAWFKHSNLLRHLTRKQIGSLLSMSPHVVWGLQPDGAFPIQRLLHIRLVI